MPERRSAFQARSHDRIEKIISAAAFLFQEVGVEPTSPADIATQAKVTRTSLYRFFKDKLQILQCIAERQLHGLANTLDLLELDSLSTDEAVELLIKVQLNFIKNEVGYMAVWNSVASLPIFSSLLSKKKRILMSVWGPVLDPLLQQNPSKKSLDSGIWILQTLLMEHRLNVPIALRRQLPTLIKKAFFAVLVPLAPPSDRAVDSPLPSA